MPIETSDVVAELKKMTRDLFALRSVVRTRASSLYIFMSAALIVQEHPFVNVLPENGGFNFAIINAYVKCKKRKHIVIRYLHSKANIWM